MSIINGTDLIVYVDDVAIAGSTSHTLNVGNDMRDTSTKSSAGWKDQLPSQRNWTIDGEALFSFVGSVGFTNLFTLLNSKTRVVLKFTTGGSTTTRWTGNAYLSSLSANAPNEDNTTFSYTFEGVGLLVPTTIT